MLGCTVHEVHVCVRRWVVFLSLPPSLQQTVIRVEVLKNRGEPDPSLHGWSPPFRRETSRDSPLAAFGILIVGALWRKSWKANWMWGLEAVRELGPGGGRTF